jgi:hypothetical protein
MASITKTNKKEIKESFLNDFNSNLKQSSKLEINENAPIVEQKILIIILAFVQRAKPVLSPDLNSWYLIPKTLMFDLLDWGKSKNYGVINDHLSKIKSYPLKIKGEQNSQIETIEYNLLRGIATPKDTGGYYGVLLEDIVVQELKNPESYLSQNLFIMLSLRDNKYTKVFYNFLFTKNIESGKNNFEFTLSYVELKLSLGMTENAYPNWHDFKRGVLDKIIDEINTKSNYFVEYKLIRKNKKIDKIDFFVEEQEWKDSIVKRIEKLINHFEEEQMAGHLIEGSSNKNELVKQLDKREPKDDKIVELLKQLKIDPENIKRNIKDIDELRANINQAENWIEINKQKITVPFSKIYEGAINNNWLPKTDNNIQIKPNIQLKSVEYKETEYISEIKKPELKSKIWPDCLKKIESVISKKDFNQFIVSINAYEKNGELILFAPSQHVIKKIEKEFINIIKNSIETSPKPDIKILVG